MPSKTVATTEPETDEIDINDEEIKLNLDSYSSQPKEEEKPAEQNMATFSMSQQIQEFKRKLEEDKMREVEEFEKKVHDEAVPYKMRIFTDTERQHKGKQPSIDSLRDSLVYSNSGEIKFNRTSLQNTEIDGNFDIQSLRGTEINAEWESIIREQTRKQKEGIPDQRGSFLDFVNERKSRLRETTKTYNRKGKGVRAGGGQIVPDRNTFVDLSQYIDNDPDKKKEKAEINAILKIELIIVMLKRKNLHLNVISDFEQNRCKNYLQKF